MTSQCLSCLESESEFAIGPNGRCSVCTYDRALVELDLLLDSNPKLGCLAELHYQLSNSGVERHITDLLVQQYEVEND